MEKITLQTQVECFDDPMQLAADERDLLLKANEAKDRAYAPYSDFKVGAALLLEGGHFVLGNNQENMAYPSGLCAERVAFYAAGANYPGRAILKVAITAASMHFESDHPVSPCGACRQAMLEYEMNQEMPIVLILRGTTGKIYRISGIRQLLPLFFHEGGLKKH